MEMMYLKLELDQSLGKGTTSNKTIPIRNEDVNLIECIRSAVGEDCRISFQRYYQNTSLTNFEYMFPYIISNEIIRWYVPFDEVTIRDFRNTHNLDSDSVIYAEIDNYGGGGGEVSELISWIVSNWDIISSGLSDVSSSITIISFIHKIYKFFANKKNRLPDFGDVQEVIDRQDTWDCGVLMKLLKVDDAELMDCLSYSIGYKKVDNYYIKESVEKESAIIIDNTDSIWGVQTCSRWTCSLTREIHQLNILLTDLKFRFEILDLQEFHNMEDEVDKIIDKWDSYLEPGENLCFVKLIDPPRSYDRNEIESDINNLKRHIQVLLDRVTKLERREGDGPLGETEDITIDLSEDFESEESEGYDESNHGDEDSDIDFCVSPWEILLTRLLLKNQLAEIFTDHGTIIAFVDQIYDYDVLLQALSKDGVFLGYQTCDYYDIKMITTETKELKALEEEVPKCEVPSIPAHGISAKSYILDYAMDNELIAKVYVNDMSISPINSIVLDIEEVIGLIDNSMIKLQLLNECGVFSGNAWIEMSSVEQVSIPSK